MKRDHVVSIRLTENEYEFLKERARTEKRSVSNLLRSWLRLPVQQTFQVTDVTTTTGGHAYIFWNKYWAGQD